VVGEALHGPPVLDCGRCRKSVRAQRAVPGQMTSYRRYFISPA